MTRTTTRKNHTPTVAEIKAQLAAEGDFLRPLVEVVVQQVLEAEMSEPLGADKGERTEGRLGYRSGYYVRSLVSRVGKLELRVPQDRQGALLHAALRAISTQREGLGRGAGRDVCPRGKHAQG